MKQLPRSGLGQRLCDVAGALDEKLGGRVDGAAGPVAEVAWPAFQRTCLDADRILRKQQIQTLCQILGP
jgi:hypothetical protein